MKLIKIFPFIFAFVFVSCDKKSELEATISKIPVSFKTLRYDLDFYNATPDSLQKLKAKYPYLFPKQFSDEIWENKLRDTLIKNLSGVVVEKFSNFGSQEQILKSFFQHIKYYFPKEKQPDIVTVISEVDYQNKVIYTDSLVLIALDNYLGKKHKYYEGIYDYFTQNMEISQIVVDICNAFSEYVVRPPTNRTFLSRIVYEGKKMYLKDLLIPTEKDNTKIGYTPEQYQWAKEYESYIWSYFIEKQLIYSTDLSLSNRFILPAPYSKFYLAIDKDSPARIGQFIGWRIVRSYMNQNSETSVKNLLHLNAETLFKKSKYKPNK